MPNILFAGGGSGGHITPSIAIAQEFKAKYPKSKVLFVISENKLDQQIMQDHLIFPLDKGGQGDFGQQLPFFHYTTLPTAKLRRYFSLQNFLDFFKFFANIWKSLKILKNFQADLVFSKGGFIALPIAIAALLEAQGPIGDLEGQGPFGDLEGQARSESQAQLGDGRTGAWARRFQ